MYTHITRRWSLVALALTITSLALISASSAVAMPDCDLTPDAPICNPGDDPPPKGGGGSKPGGGSSTIVTASRTDTVGLGQLMSTTATANRSTAVLSATTRTWTTNPWWGYHGCVAFDLIDFFPHVMRRTAPHCFGVDGTAIPGLQSDRTDAVVEALTATEAASISAIGIVHFAA